MASWANAKLDENLNYLTEFSTIVLQLISTASAGWTIFAVVIVALILLIHSYIWSIQHLSTVNVPPEPILSSGQADKGILDFLVEGEEATKKLIIIMNKVNSDTIHTTKKTSRHAGRLKRAKNPGKIRKIATSAAKDIEEYARTLVENLLEFDQSNNIVSTSYIEYFKRVNPSSDEERDELTQLKSTVSGVLASSHLMTKAFTETIDATNSLKGISQDLNRSITKIEGVLPDFISSFDGFEQFCRDLIDVIDDKILNCKSLQSVQIGTKNTKRQGRDAG